MESTVGTLIVVNILAEILPHFGVNLGSDVLTNVVQGAIAIVSGIWGFYHYKGVVAAARQAGAHI